MSLKKNNPGIKIIVFGYDEDKGIIYPRRNSKLKVKNDICLLFYSNGEKKHYAWIKNFDKLMVNKGNSTHACENCMNPFQSLQALRNHEKFCDLPDGF